MRKVTTQEHLETSLSNIFRIFSNSAGEIRPHFILTGASGTGKTYTVQTFCDDLSIPFVEVNGATLTKEGTSGNSLSKALSKLAGYQGMPVVCFVDEFDKLFISGNMNSSDAHETTLGVQNEFLKVLESNVIDVMGDYGKYPQINVENVLFVFAGAFNGETDISIERLKELGVKTEFLGRVGLLYETTPVTLEMLYDILENSPLLSLYLEMYKDTTADEVIEKVRPIIAAEYEKNTVGVRMIQTLIHKYFIQNGVMEVDVVESPKPKKKMIFSKS